MKMDEHMAVSEKTWTKFYEHFQQSYSNSKLMDTGKYGNKAGSGNRMASLLLCVGRRLTPQLFWDSDICHKDMLKMDQFIMQLERDCLLEIYTKYKHYLLDSAHPESDPDKNDAQVDGMNNAASQDENTSSGSLTTLRQVSTNDEISRPVGNQNGAPLSTDPEWRSKSLLSYINTGGVPSSEAKSFSVLPLLQTSNDITKREKDEACDGCGAEGGEKHASKAQGNRGSENSRKRAEKQNMECDDDTDLRETTGSGEGTLGEVTDFGGTTLAEPGSNSSTTSTESDSMEMPETVVFDKKATDVKPAKSGNTSGGFRSEIVMDEVDGDIPLLCAACKKEFATSRELTTHFRTHDEIEGSKDKNPRAFLCVECNTAFRGLYKLKLHYRIHTGARPHNCEVCGKKFRLVKGLEVHLRTHSKNKPYKCDLCPAGFLDNNGLNRHRRAHQGEKTHVCELCGQQFSNSTNLGIHRRLHTGEKPYKCEICDLSFTQATALKVHIRTHNGEKPYRCDICNWSFASKTHLTTHLRTHTSERPYKCDKCSFTGPTKHSVKTHQLIHSDAKPFSCPECDMSFKRKAHLQSHAMTHQKKSPFKCNYCTASFLRAGLLKKHKQRCHDGKSPGVEEEEAAVGTVGLSGSGEYHTQGCNDAQERSDSGTGTPHMALPQSNTSPSSFSVNLKAQEESQQLVGRQPSQDSRRDNSELYNYNQHIYGQHQQFGDENHGRQNLLNNGDSQQESISGGHSYQFSNLHQHPQQQQQQQDLEQQLQSWGGQHERGADPRFLSGSSHMPSHNSALYTPQLKEAYEFNQRREDEQRRQHPENQQQLKDTSRQQQYSEMEQQYQQQQQQYSQAPGPQPPAKTPMVSEQQRQSYPHFNETPPLGSNGQTSQPHHPPTHLHQIQQQQQQHHHQGPQQHEFYPPAKSLPTQYSHHYPQPQRSPLQQQLHHQGHDERQYLQMHPTKGPMYQQDRGQFQDQGQQQQGQSQSQEALGLNSSTHQGQQPILEQQQEHFRKTPSLEGCVTHPFHFTRDQQHKFHKESSNYNNLHQNHLQHQNQAAGRHQGQDLNNFPYPRDERNGGLPYYRQPLPYHQQLHQNHLKPQTPYHHPSQHLVSQDGYNVHQHRLPDNIHQHQQHPRHQFHQDMMAGQNRSEFDQRLEENQQHFSRPQSTGSEPPPQGNAALAYSQGWDSNRYHQMMTMNLEQGRGAQEDSKPAASASGHTAASTSGHTADVDPYCLVSL